ncbi:MAG: hypothetical protein OCD03_00690 [Hyphomicrobiales bacterium]
MIAVRDVRKNNSLKLLSMTSLTALLTACVSSSHETHTGTTGDDVMRGSADKYDTFLSSLGADNIDGIKGDLYAYGRNLIDYSQSNLAVKVVLDGVTVGMGGHAQGDVLINIADAIGSAFNDEITGNELPNELSGGAGADKLYGLGGNDVLSGGLGADILDGGLGTDKVEYITSLSGVTIDLALGTATGGEAEGDVFISIENITGSGFADILTGDTGENTLFGGAGADVINGGAGNDYLVGEDGNDQIDGEAGDDYIDGGMGNDTLIGGTGNDRLIGEDGNDTLSGGADDDYLNGGAGVDILQGGGGIDEISYIGSSSGVIVNLLTQIVSGGEADGDVISSIENATGTRFDDVLVGAADDNILDGYTGGFDKIDGGAGNDTAKLGVDYFHIVKPSPLELTILKVDGKIAFDFYNHTGELQSIETIKYADDAGSYELDVSTSWAILASEEQAKFTDEADFLIWLGADAGYNYEGL